MTTKILHDRLKRCVCIAIHGGGLRALKKIPNIHMHHRNDTKHFTDLF